MATFDLLSTLLNQAAQQGADDRIAAAAGDDDTRLYNATSRGRREMEHHAKMATLMHIADNLGISADVAAATTERGSTDGYSPAFRAWLDKSIKGS